MSEGLKSLDVVGSIGGELVEEIKQLGKFAVIRYTPVGDKAADMVLSLFRKALDVKVTQDIAGISPDEASTRDFVQYVLALGAVLEMLGEDVAEVATESVSDAMSNMMYSGFFGHLDAVLRQRVGGIPPQSPLFLDGIDTEWKAWLDSTAGTNYWATVWQYWAKKYADLAESLHSDPLVRGVIDAYRYITYIEWFLASQVSKLMEQAVGRLYESMVAALEALFARVVDAEQEYLATEVAYQQGIVPETEYTSTVAKIDAEITAAEQELDEIIQDFKDALNEFLSEWYPPLYLTQFVQQLESAIDGAVSDEAAELGAYAKKLYELRTNGRPAAHTVSIRDETDTEIAQVTVQ
jgi:uncharacterized protein YqiB (DUF1249 family)